MANNLFRLSVEIGIMIHLLATTLEVTDDELYRLRGRCVSEVKKTQGGISLDAAVEFQQGSSAAEQRNTAFVLKGGVNLAEYFSSFKPTINRNHGGDHLKIERNEANKPALFWLTKAEQEDATLRKRLKEQCTQYKEQKYIVAVFCSG